MGQFQILGLCKCGRQVATTRLIGTEEEPVLQEAQVVCGSCQRAYRIILHEEETPHNTAPSANG